MELGTIDCESDDRFLQEVEPCAAVSGHRLDNGFDGQAPAGSALGAIPASLAAHAETPLRAGGLGARSFRSSDACTAPIRSLPFLLLLALAREYLRIRDERAALRTALRRSMPGAALAQLAARNWRGDPVQMSATVMFGDIQGFTSFSEGVAPEAVIALLNEYFSLVSAPIRLRAGVITQYQGDAFLAVFHLPVTKRNHAADAVRAALAIQRLLRRSRFAGERRIHTRIGIATGVIAAGLVGSREQANFTIHGDAVNLAARLERLNKQLGTSVLVSQATAMLAGREVEARCRGRFEIAGKGERCTVYEAVEPRQAGRTQP